MFVISLLDHIHHLYEFKPLACIRPKCGCWCEGWVVVHFARCLENSRGILTLHILLQQYFKKGTEYPKRVGTIIITLTTFPCWPLVAFVAATNALLEADNDVSSAVSALLAGSSKDNYLQGQPSNVEASEANPAEAVGEEQDAEMEGELTKDVTGDPYAEYDVSVKEEIEAIGEYLALIDSSMLAK